MDELLQEFLGETGEHLDMVDRELVRFEQEPNNGDILRNIFRLVHTVKGTCGFIGLPRLEALTHAAESVIGQFRDGASVSSTAVTAILETIDRIKEIMAELAEKGQEPPGHDGQLIDELRGLAQRAKQELAARQTQPPLDPVAAYLARTAGTRPAEPAPPPTSGAAVDEMDLVFRAAPSPLDQPGQAHGDTARDLKAAGPATLRVNVDTLEHLMTMVSELVLTRNQLLEIARRQEDAGLKGPLQRLSLITAELQDGVMKTRMQPIGNAWSKLPRIVRDLSTDLGKKIELVTEGADTELDRQILELIKDPLIHMVRNCADHAIEEPQERAALGKPEMGTIRVSAYHEGGSVTIAITDDGRGMDTARIRRKAVQRGLVGEAEAERLSETQVLRFIFHPGFSTSDTVSAISGRGVGMDVVKVNVDAIGGMIDVASIAGAGTTITIKIPLTLAIVSALIVATAGQRFAIPQVVVRELVRVKAGGEHSIERINNAPVLRLRERLLPIIALAGVMDTASDAIVDDGFIVVTQVGERQFGILVESVFHTEEIVVKPMSTRLRHIPLFSGNTILGDGAVVLIVDPNGVARLVGVAAPQDEAASDISAEAALPVERTTMLVFRAGKDRLKAVPLSLVTRLEEVDAGLFETGGGRTLLNYRGRLMPVVPIEDVQLRQSGLQPLVIFSEGDFSMALAVDAIVDIVDEVLDIEMLAMPEHGLLGSAIVRGRATEILDLAHYLPKANPNWLHVRRSGIGGPRVLLVEPSEFLREMLAPVLKAAGLQVIHVADLAMAAGLASGSTELNAVVIDLDRNAEAAFALAARLRAEARHADLRIIGLASLPTPELHVMAAQAEFDEVVAKFDRRTLIAELAETRPKLRRAA
ncbi:MULTISPECIES: chemotaxis protein CheW [unclassified Bosea (in: a-proteobacteria)]|uniref:hybrid sensor histidine kinase/response regulator n=1 Tax=unclassified Bosea (in: a-proteobacteria) TaxID=2653178 RepID=UPI000F756D1C|nr:MULTISPECIES: chemotaxis protein CheW [unclassified Bosea (in: a-proteobacteria)]AZO76185.1 hybrid sensor histidine kinase/response regulator [Bosea sp. Tri-49]RXT26107.1 hybrid sensor histidine kinase/response regulator [Bosea sp. Tri-39]RXT31349.1 hybrid sensor histidine kinase/response regulator [Bosea sp. Tri-54]